MGLSISVMADLVSAIHEHRPRQFLQGLRSWIAGGRPGTTAREDSPRGKNERSFIPAFFSARSGHKTPLAREDFSHSLYNVLFSEMAYGNGVAQVQGGEIEMPHGRKICRFTVIDGDNG